jgi:hypothetical protein
VGTIDGVKFPSELFCGSGVGVGRLDGKFRGIVVRFSVARFVGYPVGTDDSSLKPVGFKQSPEF